MNRIKFTHLLLLLILTSTFNFVALGQQKPEKPIKLQHWMTPQEAKLRHLIGKDARVTDPPDGPVTNIAEFDKMQSVLIRYSFGISYDLIAEMSQKCNVTTIVASQSEQTYVTNQYQNQGVNLDNCDFIIAPSNSYWTRDYGPWFIFDGNDEMGITDFTYNRPRPNDNAIPAKVAEELDINLFEMDIVTAGGNYMTDGMGIAASSDLIWSENSGYTVDEINEIFQEYLGIETYHVLDDPNNTYIDHIDCWGKYLDVDKVLIRSVPESHPQYDEIEATAAYFEQRNSSYGMPYQVFRVYTPNDQPYTNSLILNKRVFVPITGSQWDDDAIATYQEAMPGYEVLGFTGSWQSTDALHCRTKGIADIGMLHIRHMPLLAEQPVQADYTVEATLKAFSGSNIYADSVLIYYRVNGSDWLTSSMNNTSGQLWEGSIPGAAQGSQIDYYIYAADESGKRQTHPFVGEPDPHTFFVGEQAFAHINITPGEINATATTGSSATETLTICNTGELELNFSIEANTAVYGEIPVDVPNSPSPGSWDHNTYDEEGWTDIEVSQEGELGGVEIAYTWSTDTWPEEGSFHLESPSGTQAVIASGDPSGTYTVDMTEFNGEELNGTWKMWIEDTYGDGGHQATDITITFTTVISEIPWLVPAQQSGTIQPGDCTDIDITCDAAELSAGLHTGMLSVESNDPDNPEVEILVNFEVTEFVDVTVAPDTLWFLTMDDMINGKMLYISNETTQDILINEITETGTNFSWMFEEPLPTLPYNLEAGDELELKVVIPIPPQMSVLSILYDDLNIVTEYGEHTVVVAWNEEAYQPDVSIAPDTLWFETAQQAWIDGIPFTVTNTGNVPLTIYNLPVEGTMWEIPECPVVFPYTMEIGESIDFNVMITIVTPPDAYLYEDFEIETQIGNYPVVVALNDVILGIDDPESSETTIYPNPFAGSLNINLCLQSNQNVRIDVLDMNGKMIDKINESELQAGNHRLTWNATDRQGYEVRNGIYFIRIKTGDKTKMIKVIKSN